MDATRTIRQARTRAGMSLRELARASGTSHSTLAAYEQGRKTPRTDTLSRICRAAGFAIDGTLEPRPGRADPDTAADLLDVLALADAFGFERTGPLTYPRFPPTGRR